MKSVLLLSNGPGELWGWARPLAKELKSRGMKTVISLLPCQFASGEEVGVAENIGVDEVMGPVSLLKTVRNMISAGKRTDAVLQLGGDLLWGRLAAKMGGVPLLCYSYGRKNGLNRCDRVFTAFSAMTEGMAGASVAGDLVKDSLEMEGEAFLSAEVKKKLTIAFFPGSRTRIRTFALPFLIGLVEALGKEFPSFEPRVVLSPFVPSDEKHVWRSAGFIPVSGGGRAVLLGVDFAVTQPGTNTLELMHCRVPFIVLVPFASLRKAPLPGVPGLIAALPGVGPRFREWALKKKGGSAGFLAWPNRLARKAVVDEMFGDFTPEDAAVRIASWLRDQRRLEDTRSALASLSLLSPAGAARRMVDEMERMFARI